MTVHLKPSVSRDLHVIERVSPTRGEIVSCEKADASEACQRFAAQAAAAFPDWSATQISDRARLLVNMANILERRADELSASIVQEIATPIDWARHNVTYTADDVMVMCEGNVTLHARPGDTTLQALAAASFGHEDGEAA